MVFWAGNFIVVKGAIGILPPIGFTFLRYCVAAVTLLVLLRWREGAIRLPHGDIIRIGLLGIVGFGCYQILWPVALQSIPAGDSALLIAATPVITAVLAMSIGADTPNPVKLAGALVSFSGVALVVAAGEGLDLAVLDRRRRPDPRRGGMLGRSTRSSARPSCGGTRRWSRRPGRSWPGPCSSRRSGSPSW